MNPVDKGVVDLEALSSRSKDRRDLAVKNRKPQFSRLRRCHHCVAMSWLLLWFTGTLLWGQSPESDNAPALGEFEPAPVLEPQKPFLVPDIPDSVQKSTQVNSRWFTLKPGLVSIM